MNDQEKKDQRYNTKRPAGNDNNKLMKKPNFEKKFKGKKDTRNNNSQGTNGMHNSMPLTREHQLKLGAGQGKPSSNNPHGFSKKQLTILNFLIEQDSGSPIKNIIENGNFSSWGGESNSYKNNEKGTYKKNMSFNMFQPQVKKEETTPEKEPETDDDSTLMKQVKKDIERIENSNLDLQPTITSFVVSLPSPIDFPCSYIARRFCAT